MRYHLPARGEMNKQKEEVEPLPVEFMDDIEKLQVYNIILTILHNTILNVPLPLSVVHAYVIKNNLNKINGRP